MNLRICDGGRERTMPASVELVERTLAPGTAIRAGTEITLAEGDRWLAAIAIEGRAPADETTDLYLLVGEEETGKQLGPMERPEAVRWFVEFLVGHERGSASEARTC